MALGTRGKRSLLHCTPVLQPLRQLPLGLTLTNPPGPSEHPLSPRPLVSSPGAQLLVLLLQGAACLRIFTDWGGSPGIWALAGGSPACGSFLHFLRAQPRAPRCGFCLEPMHTVKVLGTFLK